MWDVQLYFLLAAIQPAHKYLNVFSVNIFDHIMYKSSGDSVLRVKFAQQFDFIFWKENPELDMLETHTSQSWLYIATFTLIIKFSRKSFFPTKYNQIYSKIG